MIPEQFTITRQHYERYKDFLQLYPPDALQQLYDLDLEYTLQDPKTKQFWDELLTVSFATEYKKLVKKESYFNGCPLNIYVKNFDSRKDDFVSKGDASVIDFIVNEYENIYLDIFEFCPSNLSQQISYSLTRVKEFLEEQVALTDYSVSHNVDNAGKIKFRYSKKKTVPTSIQEYSINLSDTTSIEKVTYLHLLGIIDYIKSKSPLGMSEATLASIMSSFTGIEATTLKRYLTGLHHQGDKNNPFKDPNKVKEVISKLKDLGIKLP